MNKRRSKKQTRALTILWHCICLYCLCFLRCFFPNTFLLNFMEGLKKKMPENFSRFPLSERGQVSLYLSVAVLSVLVFLIAIPLYMLFPPVGSRASETYPSISQMCNDASNTGEGRLFSVSMLIAGFCIFLSFFECHLEPLGCCGCCCECCCGTQKSKKMFSILCHCVLSISIMGVGSLPYGPFGLGMDLLHGACSGGTFVLHPVLELARLLSVENFIKTLNKAQWGRVFLSVALLGQLIAYQIARRFDVVVAAFWMEYAMTWTLGFDVLCCWWCILHPMDDGLKDAHQESSNQV